REICAIPICYRVPCSPAASSRAATRASTSSISIALCEWLATTSAAWTRTDGIWIHQHPEHLLVGERHRLLQPGDCLPIRRPPGLPVRCLELRHLHPAQQGR